MQVIGKTEKRKEAFHLLLNNILTYAKLHENLKYNLLSLLWVFLAKKRKNLFLYKVFIKINKQFFLVDD